MDEDSRTEGFFHGEHAQTYDQKNSKLAPFRDSVLLLARLACSGNPKDSRILCVGVGTGEEVLYLAQSYPAWSFVLVEPSRDMLDICRDKMGQHGLEDRCEYHHGYLDSVPEVNKFDAATCLLVSHFIFDKDERLRLYQQIARRLKSGGILINADLCANRDSATYRHLLVLWQRVWMHAGFAGDESVAMEKMMEQFEHSVALLPPSEVGSLLSRAGYLETEFPVFQSLLIHCWVTAKA